jgi:aspartyl-tRNA(Asn)/glutamyl-tRNA(Gln) amidotransferase subunit A
LPVCTVPLATRSGLPIGLQLIARPFNEEAVLRAAWALEQRGITIPQINMAGA